MAHESGVKRKGKHVKKQGASEGTSGVLVDATDKLDEELAWCIHQLQLGLCKPQAKPDSKQVKEASRVLRILQNPSAPLVKKRQAMRVTFGDYRKKMKEEEKKYSASAKKMFVSTVSQKKQQKSTFLRKACPSRHCSALHSGHGTDTDVSLSAPDTYLEGLKFGKGDDQPFQFGFSVPNSNEANPGNCSFSDWTTQSPKVGKTAVVEQLPSQERTSAASGDQVAATETAMNYYKLMPTTAGNIFQFQFHIDDQEGS